MRIGNARYCLSPDKQFYLIGFRNDNRNYPATGIHDDIYCNSILFENNGDEVFVFSADFIEFEEEMAEDVKTIMNQKFGMRRDHVLLCATHNHSSLCSYHKSWYTGKFDQEYYDFLIKIIQKSYQTCKGNLQKATAKYGRKEIYGYYGNRNHPGLPADNEIIVVKFYNEENQPFAGFINWAVHSTIISADNTYLTGDLAGYISQKMFHDFGFYPAVIVGAAGDCSNRNERCGNDFKELERVSTLLAREIANIPVNEEIELGEIQSQTLFHTIHHHMEEVHIEVKREVQKYKEELAAETDELKKQFLNSRIKELSEKLNETLFHLDVKGSVIGIGKIKLFVFPGELGSKFGIQLKKDCSHLGVVCGYTNGYYGYFMPKEEYGLSFETIGSSVLKGEPEKLIEKYKRTSKLLD